MIAVYILGALILGGLGFVAWKLTTLKTPDTGGEKEELNRQLGQLKANLEQQTEKAGELKALLEAERADKAEQQGKGKQLFAQLTKLESQLEQVSKERDALRKEIAKFEESAERRQKEDEAKIAKLDAAIRSFEDEKARVRGEDEEQRKLLEEQRDRIWADHELSVIASLTDLCKQPALSFSSYTNTNLPDGFDGSLKPDFMIDFLGQYVIFDAKVSKAKSMKAYIDEQVKKTVEKVKNNAAIHRWIFLVVPTSAITELKSHHYQVDGYHLYVISPEALPAVLSCLKHITTYEFAEQMDPQQRDNIVQLVAELDFHINLRNAADIFLSNLGTQTLERIQKTDPALADEVALKKQPMNAKAAIAASEIKKLVVNLTLQKEEIGRLVSPRASIRKQDIEDAGKMLSETLF